MFKCWIYISGENENSTGKEERLSDKETVYKNDKEVTINDPKKVSAYHQGSNRFGLFDRSINFT